MNQYDAELNHGGLWPLIMRLEDRVVLDAAGLVDDDGPDRDGQDLPVTPDFSPPSGTPQNDAPSVAETQHVNPAPNPDADDVVQHVLDALRLPAGEAVADGPRVLLVSTDADPDGVIAAAVGEGVIPIVFDPDRVTLDALLAQVRTALNGHDAASIGLVTHGAGDGFDLLSGYDVNFQSLSDPGLRNFWTQLGEMVRADGRIDLLACDLTDTAGGQRLLTELEQITGTNFAASDDATGNANVGGDWMLESDRVDAAKTYFDAGRIAAYHGVLADTEPTITDSDSDTTAYANEGEFLIDPNITVTDATPTDDLTGATVRIRSGFRADQDVLSYDDSVGGPADLAGISGSYDASTGILALSGNATPAEYQAVLRTVTYENASGNPDEGARDIVFTIGDNFGTYKYNPDNGHYYRNSGGPDNWFAAFDQADDGPLGNMEAYLATITSAAENTIVTSCVPVMNAYWVGAQADGAGDWYWASGPESSTYFWSGGTAVPGEYVNWAGPGSPGGLTVGNPGGTWASVAQMSTRQYVIEYSLADDAAEDGLNAVVTVDVVDRNDAPVLDNTGIMSVATIQEDALDHAGSTIASIIQSAGGDRITDADADALEGLAIIGLDDANGTWQFSIDGGTTWQDVGSVSATHALLLRDVDRIRFTPDANYNGSINSALTFRAWDRTNGVAGEFGDTSTNGGESAFSAATETASLTIAAVQDDPAAGSGIADLTATEDEPFSYQFAADAFVDVDAGDTLTYSATLANGSALPGWLTFDPTTRTFSGTPTDDAVGMWSIKVIAQDPAGNTGEQLFTLTIDNVPDAPIAGDTIPSQSASEDVGYSYQLATDAFLDPDPDDELTYVATLADGSALPAWLAFDPTTRTFSGTPTNDDVGVWMIRVVATDESGQSATQEFALEVENVNDAPVAQQPLTDHEVTSGGIFSYQVPAAAFDDVDADDVLTFEATLANGSPLPAWLSFDPASGLFFGTPGSGDIGTLQIRVVATDLAGAVAVQDFMLRVESVPPPDPPAPPGGRDNTPRDDSGASGGEMPTDSGAADLPTGAGDAFEVDAISGDDVFAEDADGATAEPDAAATDGGSAAGPDESGGETSVDGGSSAEGAAPDATAGLPSDAGPTAANRDRQDDIFDTDTSLATQLSTALLTGDLLSDDTQPAEFREAWNSILSAYADSGEEVAAYLDSAFRTVSESAFIHQAAEQARARLEEELEQSLEAGFAVDVDTLLIELDEAAAAVKRASIELERAILAAAEAGRHERFDQVLEDVIKASMQQLMRANEQLFVASQAAVSAADVIRTARVDGHNAVPAEQLDRALAAARESGHDAIREMRLSWDRVAQDVFAAFVQGVVARQDANGAESLQPPQPDQFPSAD